MKQRAYAIYSAALYFSLLQLLRVLAWFMWKPEIIGKDKFPKKGGVLVCPTHRSYVDSIMAGLITRRRVYAMAKSELFEGNLGWLFRALGAYPVKRGEADRAALRQVGTWLEQGKCVLVFPEGTRKEGRHVEELKDGVGYLAAKYGGIIVTAGFAGTEEAMPRNKKLKKGKIVAVLGDPIVVEKSEHIRTDTKEITAKLNNDLQKLLDDAYSRRDN